MLGEDKTMKKLNEINFTPEVLEKIEECKNAEELVKLASENDVELSLEDAEKYFKEGLVKLSDKNLDMVAGGVVVDRCEDRDVIVDHPII